VGFGGLLWKIYPSLVGFGPTALYFLLVLGLAFSVFSSSKYDRISAQLSTNVSMLRTSAHSIHSLHSFIARTIVLARSLCSLCCIVTLLLVTLVFVALHYIVALLLVTLVFVALVFDPNPLIAFVC
jgi:hypothetical protein